MVTVNCKQRHFSLSCLPDSALHDASTNFWAVVQVYIRGWIQRRKAIQWWKKNYFFPDPQVPWCRGREKSPLSHQCHWWKSTYNEHPSLKVDAWMPGTAAQLPQQHPAWCHGALAEQLESFAWLYQESFTPLQKDDKSRKLEHPRHQQEVH